MRSIPVLTKSARYKGEMLAQTMILLKGGEADYTFLMPCSHLIFDGMSHESFCSQLLALYGEALGQAASKSSTERLDYRDYLDQIQRGPSLTNEEEIVSVLQLGAFSEAVAQYKAASHNQTFESFHYTFRLDSKPDEASARSAMAAAGSVVWGAVEKRIPADENTCACGTHRQKYAGSAIL